MEKINAVYSVNNKLSGGLRPPERKASEIRNMNSDCKIYDMSKPVPYEEFSSWPTDIQREYLKKLYWTHGGTYKSIANILGCSTRQIERRFEEMGIPRRKKGVRANADELGKRWEAFIKGRTLVKDMIPEETKEKLENLVKEPPVEVIKNEEAEIKKEEITKSPAQALAEAIALLAGTGAEITLKITL